MDSERSTEILNLASDAGHILLENGAEISRVEETMKRIASHYGEDREHFFVLSNGIFTTGRSYANVEFIPIKGARLDMVVEVNQLSREISEGKYTLEEARARLEEIRRLPAKPLWECIAGAALGSGGIYGFEAIECNNITTESCTLRECSYGALALSACTGALEFKDIWVE